MGCGSLADGSLIGAANNGETDDHIRRRASRRAGHHGRARIRAAVVAMTNSRSQPKIEELIERINRAQVGWLPTIGEVVTVTFDVSERDILVEAVNSHAALAKALEDAREFLDPDLDPPRKSNREMIEQIDGALSHRSARP